MRWICLLFSCLYSISALAIGESCSQIWTQASRPNSAVPAWGYCLVAGNPNCYDVTGATTINNLNSTFGPGNYQIGTHQTANNIDLNATGATVRIFVSGNLTIRNNAKINETGSAKNLLIVVTGTLTVDNNAEINAFFLVGGSASFGNNSVLNGGVTAGGSITWSNNTSATYDAGALAQLNGGVVCSGSPEPEQIDHFELAYTGQAFTCKAETFTIKACKNAACSELITSNVSATLSPATGWTAGTGLSGNTINFSGGTATATLSQTTVAAIQVGVSGATPSLKPGSQTLCQIGTSLSSNNCTVAFADSGLLFSVPDKIAGKAATGILVKAMKSDGSQQCVPSFANVSRTVKFWSSYNSPITPSASPARLLQVSNGGAYTNISTSVGSATAFSLSFNSSGEASIDVNYSDAGQVTLHASYNGSVATSDLGLVMNGADQFVSRPAGLCIAPLQTCAIADHTCPGYVKAGDTFSLPIRAMAWQSDIDSNFCDNTSTPSFQLSGISIASTLLQPSGGSGGSWTPSSYNHTVAADATTTVSARQTEVGIFNLAASFNGSYLGMSINLTSSMPSPLGRIVPHRFTLLSPTLPAACGTFSYFEQPALLSFTLQAENAAGNRVMNYRNAYAKATATLVAENNNDGVDRTNRLNNTTNLLSWTDGQAILTNSNVSIKRNAAEDGPFSQLRIGLKLLDNDDLDAQLQGLDQRVDNNVNCTADCTSKMLTSGDMDWRYGRLQIINALGSEQSNLPVQLKAQYWNGSQFVPNSLDSCTIVMPTKLLVSAGANPVITASGNTATLQQGSSGALDLLLSPPGIASRYPLQYQLSDRPWLQYDWTPGGTTLLENPQGEAVFGSFRGNNRQIYWREN